MAVRRDIDYLVTWNVCCEQMAEAVDVEGLELSRSVGAPNGSLQGGV